MAADGLGTADVALNASGSVTASQLFSPYGSLRYSSGTMLTDYGFTGQHADGTSGLDYYVARYYDPIAGQFTSPDTILPGNGYDVWGLSRYAYVEGDPETLIDPTGHCFVVVCAVKGIVGLALGVGYVAYSLASGSLSLALDPGGTAIGLGVTAWKVGPTVASNPRRALARAFAWAAEGVGTLHDQLTTGDYFDRGRTAGRIVATILSAGLPAARLGSLARVGTVGRAAGAGETVFRSGATGFGGRLTVNEARAAAEAAGMDTRSMEFVEGGASSSNFGSITRFGGTLVGDTRYGGELERAANGRFVVRLYDPGLVDERQAVMTIAHELRHIRDFLDTGTMPNGPAIDSEELAGAAYGG